jgi:O-antigen/teichoic acid export membrane protein
VLLARGLAPARFGIYGVVYSVLLSVELIGRLGLPQAVTKLAAEAADRDRGVEATAVTVAGGASVALFLAFWVAAPWLAGLLRIEDGARLFRIAALDIPFYVLFFIAIALLNGHHRHLAAGVATGCYATVKLAGIAVLVALGATVEGALVVNVVGSAAGLAAATVAIGGRAFVPSLADWRVVLRLALPVSLRGAGVQLLANVGLWALSALGGAADQATKGLYVAALSLARVPNVTVYGTTGVLIASVSRARAAGDRAMVAQLLQGASRFLLIVLAPACALLCVNPREVITLLFSAEYAAGAGIMVVLVVALGFFFSVLLALTGVLIAASKAGHAARVPLGATVAATLLCLVLVPDFGAMGAAVATLIATAGAAVAAGVQVWRAAGPWLNVPVCARVLVATALVAVPSWLIETKGVLLLGELVAAGLIYVLVLPVLGLVRRADLVPLMPARLRSRGCSLRTEQRLEGPRGDFRRQRGSEGVEDRRHQIERAGRGCCSGHDPRTGRQ